MKEYNGSIFSKSLITVVAIKFSEISIASGEYSFPIIK
jgi:hypothetical protein